MELKMEHKELSSSSSDMTSVGMIDVDVQCVNDAPTITLPTNFTTDETVSTMEDVTMMLGGIVLEDVDDRDMLTVTVEANHGTVSWKWPSPGLRKWNDTTMESEVMHMNRALLLEGTL
jgi:phosphopantetheine adenylyltransferase